jgi:hypothetical protein
MFDMNASQETLFWFVLFFAGCIGATVFVLALIRPRIPDNTQDMIDNCEMQQPRETEI